jgi:hypothetical protein
MYSILNLVVGRKILLHTYYDRLTGTMVVCEKVGKRRLPFAVQCKIEKSKINSYILLRPKNFVRHVQGTDIKCKLPLSTNNLAFLSLLSF